MSGIDINPAGLPEELRHRLRHDLSGPLITARGFLEEIRAVRAELNQWLQDHRAPLSEMEGETIEELLSNDFDPCIHYLEQALSQLDDRILALSAPRPDTADDGPQA